MVIQYYKKYKTIKDQRHEIKTIMTHVTIRSLQLSALITPPGFLLLKLINKKMFTLNRVAPFTTLGSLAIAYYIMYDNLEIPKVTEKNQMIAFNLQRDRDLMFYEDWTLMGLALGTMASTFSPYGFFATALSGAFGGFYTAWGIKQLRENKVITPKTFNAFNFTYPQD